MLQFSVSYSGPTNVLYDPRAGRPSFIDFEGCHIHEGEIQKPASGRAAKVNSKTLCCPNCYTAVATQAEEGGGGARTEAVARKRGAPTAANARLPELREEGFDVFAADVWCLGAMLMDVRARLTHFLEAFETDTKIGLDQMRTFPDDDLRAHFRSMCSTYAAFRPFLRMSDLS